VADTILITAERAAGEGSGGTAAPVLVLEVPPQRWRALLAASAARAAAEAAAAGGGGAQQRRSLALARWADMDGAARRELCHRVCCCLELRGTADDDEEKQGAEEKKQGEGETDTYFGGAWGNLELVFEAANEGVSLAMDPATGGAVSAVRVSRSERQRRRRGGGDGVNSVRETGAATAATQQAAALVVSSVLSDVAKRLQFSAMTMTKI